MEGYPPLAMAYLVWTRYSFEGDKDPVSEAKYAELVRIGENEWPRTMATLRSERWAAFRRAQVGGWLKWGGPAAAGIALLVASRAAFPEFNVWAEAVSMAGAVLVMWVFARSLALTYSAISHWGALGSECNHLTRAHELARRAGSYGAYRESHLQELAVPRLTSGDSRLALVLALLGLLVVPIPICAPIAIVLGVLGLRKRKRYSMAAIMLGAVELAVFTAIFTTMSE